MRQDRPALTRVERLAWHAESVTRARFVDARRAEALARLGVGTIGELIRHWPSRYVDLTRVCSIADAPIGQEATIVGRIHDVQLKQPRPRLTVTEVALVDGTGVLLGVWFNQPWTAQRFIVGERVALAGTVEFDYGMKRIVSPFVERLSDEEPTGARGRILPVHRATEGLTTGWLRRLIAAALEDFGDVPDHLPWAIRSRRALVPLARALKEIHFPTDADARASARRRLAYDELFMLQLFMAMRRHALTRERAGIAHVVDGPALAALRNAVPFSLTSDQTKAVEEILADMAAPRPMNRMLLGDVGTGKTIVAAHALAAVADTRSQAAMMAPTEVLARQYAAKVGPLLDAARIPWGLLTGSVPSAERRDLLARAHDGSLTVLFGTHALLQEDVRFKRLTLAIVDEQHRFGVNQRLGLRDKGALADMLVMSATPIPRTVALTLYGDLATSYLRERPHASAPPVTRVIRPHEASVAYEAVRTAVREGRQAYVICAMVDENDEQRAKAATREAERLAREVFPDLRVGLLTGRMRPQEKAAVMDAFADGRLDVLVSTTVVEVGIDVPNATTMIVEDAHRFGLAQLHQLRGRVARGATQGEVWLVADARTRESRERLAVLAEVTDGFELAEHDLRLRGEGEVLGDRQHGIPPLRIASLLEDATLVREAREDAFELVLADPHLRAPEHAPLASLLSDAYADAWRWLSAG